MEEEKADRFQQQLIDARRNQILDAATAVFADKGFSRATIRDVARTAGVADGTIYNYFRNKEALLIGLLDRVTESNRRPEMFARSEEMTLDAFVAGMVRGRFAAMTPDALRIMQVVLSEVLVDNELRQQYFSSSVAPGFAVAGEYFARWAADGTTASLDPNLTPRAFSGMILGLILLRLMGDTYLQEHWEGVPDVVTALFLHGLSPQTPDDNDADS